MTANMEALLKILSENSELGHKFAQMDKQNLIASAKELGVELTDADFAQPETMSDAELNAVAGGGECVCVLGGGGTQGGDDGVCACVAYGQGNVADDSQYVYRRGAPRCQCFVGGTGEVAEEYVRSYCCCGGVTYE